MKKTIKSLMLAGTMLLFISSMGGVAFAEQIDASESKTVIESDSTSKVKRVEKGERKNKSFSRVNVISIAAQVMGLTEDEVKEFAKSDKVGTLLIQNNKVEEFKTAYLLSLKTKLDEAVVAGKLTQASADDKYAIESEKILAYDGTTHLCGKEDHSNMFNKDKTQ